MKRAAGWSLCVLALGACNAILGNEERSLYRDASATGGSSAGGNAGSGASGGASGDGSSGNGGSGGSGGSSGSGTDASLDADADAPPIEDCDAGVTDDAGLGLCPGGVMYVSDSGGSDSSSGCSPCFPKATLTGALAAIRAATSPDAGGQTLPPGFSVHVCAGDYAEVSLLLDLPVSLRGGYDCSTWARSPGYGWPTFDKLAETVIRNGDATKQPDSMRVQGTLITSSVEIEGFTIRGWHLAAPVVNSVALGIRAGAAPLVTNNLIEGGASKGPGTGMGLANVASTGVWVDNASPDVVHNQIHGGSGTGADVGSVGVIVRGASSKPKLHENVIRGGSGIGLVDGSIGIRAFDDASMTVLGGNPITKNEIFLGTGSESSSSGRSAAGVILNVAGDVIDNQIRGETNTAANGVVMGVYLAGEGLIARNRIYTGTAAATSSAVGIQLQNQSARVENNMISASSAGVAVIGIWLTTTEYAALLHNTIYTGLQPAAFNPKISPIFLDFAPESVIRGNLLLAEASENTMGFRLVNCLANVPIAELYDNTLVNIDDLAFGTGFNCPGAMSSMPAIEAASTMAGGNHYYRGTGACGGQGGCLELAACPGSAGTTESCFNVLFNSWTGTDEGLSELFGSGWLLKSNSTPCNIVLGSPTKSVATDLYGSTRTPSLSRGAHELDLPCN